MVDKKLALAMLEGPCPECNGAGGFTERTGPTDVEQYACPTCLGRGVYYVLDPDGKLGLRVQCVIGEHHDAYGEAWHGHYPDVHQDKDCPGWTPTDDLPTWMEAAAGLNTIVTIRNDGPGWRCDLHRIDEHRIVTGWSDGGFTLSAPPKYRPYPLEALLNALAEVLLKGEHA